MMWVRMKNRLRSCNEELKRTRGYTEIINKVTKCFGETSKELDIPSSCQDVAKKLVEEEQILFQRLDDLREHFIHQFHVFLLAFTVVDLYGVDKFLRLASKAPRQGQNRIKNEEELLRAIFLQSLWHDNAYFVENIENWWSKYPTILPTASFNWDSLWQIAFKYFSHFSAMLQSKNKDQTVEVFMSQVTGVQTTEDKTIHNHGILGSINLLESFANKDEITAPYFEAALSIAIHNMPVWEPLANAIGRKLRFKDYPLQFLLLYSDFVQEWGRRAHRGIDINGETKLHGVEIRNTNSGKYIQTNSINLKCTPAKLEEQIEKLRALLENSKKFALSYDLTNTSDPYFIC